MCLTVAYGRSFRALNRAQELAGTGVFFSNPRGLKAAWDDPVQLAFGRLHWKSRHEEFVVAGQGVPLPQFAEFTGYDIYGPYSSLGLEHGDALRAFLLRDEAGPFWSLQPRLRLQVVGPGPYFAPIVLGQMTEQERKLLLGACAQGRWALVLDGDEIPSEDGRTLGEQLVREPGCYLSYALPVAPAAKIERSQQEGAHGSWNTSIRVVITAGQRWALWLRRSDTGAHGGLLLLLLDWGEEGLKATPIAASLFKPQHLSPHGWHNECATFSAEADTLGEALRMGEEVLAQRKPSSSRF